MPTSTKGLRKRLLRLVAGAAAAATAHLANATPARAQAVIPDSGCLANQLADGDDIVSDAVDLGFDISFGGASYSQVFVDTNGHVRLKPSTLTWWQLHDWGGANHDVPTIGPFHADADPRPGATKVTFGPIQFGGRDAFCVNWVDIGYFDNHSDLRNSFQLLLVKRGGLGDFDIVFNYDQIAWEAGDGQGAVGGIGGTFQPRVGYFDGANGFEMPGSRTSLALLDSSPDGLIHGSADAGFVRGRYVLPIINGSASPRALGRVVDPDGNPVGGAAVQACSIEGACATGITDASGAYSLRAFTPEDVATSPFWSLKVFPPEGTLLMPPDEGFFVFPPGPDPVAEVPDAVLKRLAAPPPGAGLSPSNPGGPGGVPIVHWQSPLVLSAQSCAGAVGRKYEILRNGVIIANGPAFERASGSYEATIPALAPNHGFVEVRLVIDCGAGVSGGVSFNAYIDPSGFVFDTRGEPVVGARMTLYRASSAAGPFEAVPDGSIVMSPSNRANPSYTDESGHFGWDVMTGYYVVRAEKEGCNAPGLPAQLYVETDVLPVPPEWLDLELVLDCEAITPPVLSVPARVDATATSAQGAVVAYVASAFDGGAAVPVACSPPSGAAFPLGQTQVTCAAHDDNGNAVEASFEVSVTYAWSDVLSPLVPGGENVASVGDDVKVKFALLGQSAGVKNADARVFLEPASGPGEGGEGVRFQYKSAKKLYAAEVPTCDLEPGVYHLRIELGDGVERLTTLILVE